MAYFVIYLCCLIYLQVDCCCCFIKCAWCILSYIFCLIYLQRDRRCCYIRVGGARQRTAIRCKPVKTRQNASWEAKPLLKNHYSKHNHKFSKPLPTYYSKHNHKFSLDLLVLQAWRTSIFKIYCRSSTKSKFIDKYEEWRLLRKNLILTKPSSSSALLWISRGGNGKEVNQEHKSGTKTLCGHSSFISPTFSSSHQSCRDLNSSFD